MWLFSYFKNRRKINSIINEALDLSQFNAHDRAIEKLRNAIEIYGENYDLYVALGETYCKTSDDNEAKEWFTKAISIEPFFFIAYFYRAQLYLKEYKYKEAIKDFDRAILLFKREPLAYMKRGMCYASLNKYDEALENAIAYSRLTDDKEEAYKLVIATAIATSKTKLAKKYTDKLIKLTGESPTVNSFMARALDAEGENDKALENYNKALEEDPYNFNVLCQRGSYYVKVNEYENAKIDFARACDLDIDDAKDVAYEGLAVCYRAGNDINAAIGCYKKAIDISPDKYYYYYELSCCYFKIEDYKNSVEILEMGERECSKWPYTEHMLILKGDYYFNELEKYEESFEYYSEVVKDKYNKYVYDKMGKAKMSIGSYEDAIDCFNNIIGREEERHQHIYRVAQCYEGMKIYDKALENYTRAIEEDIDNEVYYNSRGCLYATLRKYQESIYDFEKAATLRDDVVQYKYNLALSYKEIGSLDKTIELYEKILAAEGENEYILLTLGKLCISTENIEKANKCFIKIIEINKDNKEAYYYLGYIRYFENKFEEAIGYINISMDGEENESSLLLRGRCYLESGEYSSAICDFSKLIEKSRIPDYYFYRGMAKASLKDYEGSINDYTLAIEFDSSDAQMYISRGYAYKSVGRYQEAIQDYQRAGNVNYSLKGTTYYNIGMIYDITGDYKRALYYLNKAEKINPSSDNIDEINKKREEIYSKTQKKTS